MSNVHAQTYCIHTNTHNETFAKSSRPSAGPGSEGYKEADLCFLHFDLLGALHKPNGCNKPLRHPFKLCGLLKYDFNEQVEKNGEKFQRCPASKAVQ